MAVNLLQLHVHRLETPWCFASSRSLVIEANEQPASRVSGYPLRSPPHAAAPIRSMAAIRPSKSSQITAKNVVNYPNIASWRQLILFANAFLQNKPCFQVIFADKKGKVCISGEQRRSTRSTERIRGRLDQSQYDFVCLVCVRRGSGKKFVRCLANFIDEFYETCTGQCFLTFGYI